MVFLFVFASITLPEGYCQKHEQKRRGYLEEMIPLQDQPESYDSFVSYHDKTWLDWVRRTGELPPDFDALPSIPSLPDPLVMDEGVRNISVKNASQWDGQRNYIKGHVKHLISGTFPAAPGNLESTILNERKEDGVKIQLIQLRFGKDERANLTIEVFTPPGEGPFPVFMTQWSHRGWAQIAVRRGYMGLVYAGADSKDDTRAYLALYPQHDWSTLMTRAWGAHRAVDYLYTLDHVDKSKIAISGHSRNGKQSLLAAAFDPRITAVISSSGGTGGEIPYRYTDQRHSNESIEFLYSRRTHWAHPRIRFYSGREHKLPIDQTSLMALIAPNALLLSSSIREKDGDPWAIEQAYHSLSSVYKFLNAEGKLGIRLRDGQHAVEARDIEGYMDWLDIQFKRNSLPWDNERFYDYSFEKWKALSRESVNPADFREVHTPVLADNRGKKITTVNAWKAKKEMIASQIHWVLGEKPAGVEASPIKALTVREDYLAGFMPRPSVTNGRKLNIAPYNGFGDYLRASLYYPTDENGEMKKRENGKLPVVIYLHHFSNTGYNTQSSSLFDKILSKGVAVLAFDQIGYGTRIEEGTLFYDRYPNWSKMGKMVADTQAAISALETLDYIDTERIFLSGYALGGTVSLLTAAIDERVDGVAVSSAFTPWRDAENKDHGGLSVYADLYGLLPRLGFFKDHENRVPVDFSEIISAIAPRPVLITSPQLDRHADARQVVESMKEVRSVYTLLGAPHNLRFDTPREFHGLSSSQETEFAAWLEQL